MEFILLIVNLIVLGVLIWCTNSKLNEIKYKLIDIDFVLNGIKCYELALIKQKLGIQLVDWEINENYCWYKDLGYKFETKEEINDLINLYKSIGGKEPYSYEELKLQHIQEESDRLLSKGKIPRMFSEWLMDRAKNDNIININEKGE